MDTVELRPEIALNPLEMPFTTVNKQSRSDSARGFMGGVCLVKKKYLYDFFVDVRCRCRQNTVGV